MTWALLLIDNSQNFIYAVNKRNYNFNLCNFNHAKVTYAGHNLILVPCLQI